MTTEWTFRNNTEEPIRFQLPSQEYHSVGLHGRGFVSLPDAWVMTEAVTIAPSKSITLKNRTGALFTELPKPGSRGFLVSAKLDDEFCILGCEATIKFAPEPETASIDENS